MAVVVPPAMVHIDNQKWTVFWNRLQAAVAGLAGAQSAKSIRTAAGAATTLQLADAGGLIVCTNAGLVTVSIPTNVAVAFPVGTYVDVLAQGAAGATISPNSPVTLTGGPAIAQNVTKRLTQIAPNAWVM